MAGNDEYYGSQRHAEERTLRESNKERSRSLQHKEGSVVHTRNNEAGRIPQTPTSVDVKKIEPNS